MARTSRFLAGLLAAGALGVDLGEGVPRGFPVHRHTSRPGGVLRRKFNKKKKRRQMARESRRRNRGN